MVEKSYRNHSIKIGLTSNSTVEKFILLLINIFFCFLTIFKSTFQQQQLDTSTYSEKKHILNEIMKRIMFLLKEFVTFGLPCVYKNIYFYFMFCVK